MCIIRFKKNEFLKRENHKKKDRGNGSLCPFVCFGGCSLSWIPQGIYPQKAKLRRRAHGEMTAGLYF